MQMTAAGINIEHVTTPERIAEVAKLASEIWKEHFTPLIGQAQVDYMLERFQSVPAISDQIKDGVEYWLLRVEGANAGYYALIPDTATHSAMLSKFYIHSHARGRGYARTMLQHVESRCLELEMQEVWLTVNRHNAAPIAIYEHLGFKVTGELVKDIGNGFIMDDYRMAKSIPSPS